VFPGGQGSRQSHVNHGDPLILGPVRLFHEFAQVIGVAGQKNHGTIEFQGCRGYHRIDGASVPGHACRTKELASASAKVRAHWLHGNSRQNSVDGRIARTAAKHLREGYGADDRPAAALARSFKEGADHLISP
jgi:hypothetical protein